MRPSRFGLGLLVVLALFASAMTAQAAARVATIEVKGMVWSACQASVAAALERLPGVKKVDVSLEKAQARVEFDDTKISSDKLVATIDLLGFRAKILDVKPLTWWKPSSMPRAYVLTAASQAWSNGVLNLSPLKEDTYREIYRVLRPGGRLQFADIVLNENLAPEIVGSLDAWSDWVAGAIPVRDQIELIKKTGFASVEYVGT